MNVIELADRLWRGETDTAAHHPLTTLGEPAEVAEGVRFVPSFANVSAFATDSGLFLVDTGSAPLARAVHESIRAWSDLPLDTAVYSHGHIDHVFGVPVFEEEAEERGWRRPRVIAHSALPARFDRYILTAGYNAIVNQRQFGIPGLRWPTDYRYPDQTYEDRLDLEVGGTRFELHHARGETDDHTWTWVPDRRVLCTGDLFIWASPNAGNPQKVQRYAGEWAAALREMAILDAEVLLPGHGFPVVGADRVRQALSDTAELLESLLVQTLELMNAGATLDEIIHTVSPPGELLDRPYLRPVYDEPEFVVRNIWRQYGGWWDGNPAHLHPASDAKLAGEIAGLAGGAGRLADRALELAEGASGDSEELRLAGHLAHLAHQADPADPRAAEAEQRVYALRAEAASSTMARGIYTWTSSRAAPEA